LVGLAASKFGSHDGLGRGGVELLHFAVNRGVELFSARLQYGLDRVLLQKACASPTSRSRAKVPFAHGRSVAAAAEAGGTGLTISTAGSSDVTIPQRGS
jgi:hypothetical protein